MKEQGEYRKRGEMVSDIPLEILGEGEILPPERPVLKDKERLRVIRMELTRYIQGPPIHHHHVYVVEKEKEEEDTDLLSILFGAGKAMLLLAGAGVAAGALVLSESAKRWQANRKAV